MSASRTANRVDTGPSGVDAPSPDGLDTLASDLAAASLAMARRFHHGATMWCVSPAWPHHARHVAVEFVHPVIVGKRALPALIVPGHDPVADIRVSAASGDLVVAIGGAGEPALRDLMQRAPAWGVETIWVGAGPRPPAGAANHVLWLPGEANEKFAPHNGRFILLYHLLWELTHVCFEHRGLLTDDADECTDDVCITCADEGRLAEVVSSGDSSAVVRSDGTTNTIDVTLVGPVMRHDLVLVHAGAAIDLVDAEVAP